MGGPSFDVPGYEVEIGNPSLTGCRILLSGGLLDWIDVSDLEVAEAVVEALKIREGEWLTRSELLNMSVPVTATERVAWQEIVEAHQEENLIRRMEEAITELDLIVRPSMGLNEDDHIHFQRVRHGSVPARDEAPLPRHGNPGNRASVLDLKLTTATNESLYIVVSLCATGRNSAVDVVLSRTFHVARPITT
jgi:hypothetical protein